MNTIQKLNKKRVFVAGLALVAALGSAAAMADRRDQNTSDQLHRLMAQTRDLVPFASGRLQNTGYYGQNGNQGQSQIQTMMSLGAFSGEVVAFHDTWDRYPDAPLAGALNDLDQSFRSADNHMRAFRRDGEVMRRWNAARQSYFRFRSGIEQANPNLGGQGYYRPNGNGDNDDYNYNNPNYNYNNPNPNYNGNPRIIIH